MKEQFSNMEKGFEVSTVRAGIILRLCNGNIGEVIKRGSKFLRLGLVLSYNCCFPREVSR